MISCSQFVEPLSDRYSAPLPEQQNQSGDSAEKILSGLDAFRTWPDTIFCNRSDYSDPGIPQKMHPVIASMLRTESQEAYDKALVIVSGIVSHHLQESYYEDKWWEPWDSCPPPSSAELCLMDKMNAVTQGGLFASVMCAVDNPVRFLG